MKKLFAMIAVAAMSAQLASAQALEQSKTFDNWYIGINGGVNFKTTHTSVLDNLNPSAGLRIGRYFTPVFGLAVEGEAYFDNKGSQLRPLGTFVKGIDVSLLGTTNLSNWFAGYKGQPRTFEVGAVYGLGWAHTFGTASSPSRSDNNGLTSKLGLDFMLNFGSDKQWQLYLEPSISYLLYDNVYKSDRNITFNVNNSEISLMLGLNYKFGNSNGTHNFKYADLRNQSEIDALNAKINELRADNDSKASTIGRQDQTIADLRNKLANAKQDTVIINKNTNVLQPTVIFRQGQSTIDAAQYASVSMVANYMKNHKDAKILIKGYASPEGSKELNQKLSEQRAEAVKTALVKRYGIAASRLSTQGMGATDELFDEVDFNRVATFTDTAK